MIDRINSSCESCYQSILYMARLPKVIADLNHLNTSLKLPIETEPGDKAEDREKEGDAVIVYRVGTTDERR